MKPRFSSDPNRAVAFGSLTVLPLLVWWAGWAPAIMSSDSIDQWNQALTFEFVTSHPIAHTASLWLVSRIWENPAAVTLLHVVATATLLAVVARRLVQLGIALPFAVGITWLISVLPMTGAMTVTLWKDVPFSLAMVWVATELMLMARDRHRFWTGIGGPIRLGVALGLMWALRANGRLTVIAFLLALAIGFRHQWRGILATIGGVVAVGVALPVVLVAALPVTRADIEPAQVFMPDVAAVVVHDPTVLSPADLELALAVAPIEVYEEFYACGDSTPLLFNPGYDNGVIRSDPQAYRGLIVRTLLGSPATVAGHRWCAAEYLLSPFNRTNTFIHRPPFDIWPNTLGLARDPISDRAYGITLDLYQFVERSEIEWLTWRPALVVLAGLVTLGAAATARRLRPLAWIGVFYAIHLANVAVTSPAHEFRYAYGLWLIALAALPLWYLIANPDRSTINGYARSSGVGRSAPSRHGAAGDADRQPEDPDGSHIRVSGDVATGDAVDREERNG